MSSKGTANQPTSPDNKDELLAIQLLYCMGSRAATEQKKIYDTIKTSLKKAISRVILAVEGLLRRRGLFKGSASIDNQTTYQLVVEKTDIQILKDFFHQFYESDIDKMDIKRIIAFYNCLTENYQIKQIKQNIVLQYSDLQRGSFPVEEVQIRQNQPQAERRQPINQTLLKNESLPQVTEAEDDVAEIQIVQEKSVQKVELSEESKNFIKIFTQGIPQPKGKGPILKRYKIDCLKPGEPLQHWEYHDSLIGGNVKVTFTSPKMRL